ncbi:MAG: type VI secretion system tip protein VgrG, partial [Bacteroidetes bacterium]|nr:type VI secretion system tip protein VgrG [Bacteroidota bacterium]
MPQTTVITKNLDFELWTANTIEGAEGETPLYVANFEGEEAISDLYRFHLKLVCENAEVPFDDIVGHEAGLKVRRGDHAKWYHGLIIDMEQLHQGTKWTHYRATLVPRLWKLSVNHRSRVFPDMTVPEILKKVLEDNGFVDKDDFIIQTNATYQKREFCIQYKETDLNFIRRLMEYEGIYFHFSEHTSAVDTAKPPEKEVLHIIDDRSFEEEIQYDEESHYTDALIYKPDTGSMMSETERVTHFNVRQQVVTTGVK